MASHDLFGRNREIGVLRHALAATRRGEGRVLVLEGEAGVGKSRLLEALRREASATGVRTVSSVGLDLERAVAFGVAMRLFQPLLATLDAPTRKDLLSGPAAAVVSLLDGRVPSAPSDGVDHAAGLVQGLAALAHAVSRLPDDGAGTGLLIVIDDAQWADSSTLRLVARLAADAANMPVTCVVAIRSGSPEAPEDLLDEIRVRAGRDVLVLEPLDGAAVSDWVLDELPDAAEEFVRACHLASAGIPFFLSELLAAFRTGGADPDGAAAGGITRLVPESVLRAVWMRVRELPETAQSLARSLAVLGDMTPLFQGAALAGLPDRAAEDAADALVAAHILLPTEPLRFAHPLVQAALYADIPPAARSRDHRRAAEVLSGFAVPIELVATHLARARPADDADVVARLREAARRAGGRGDYATARSFLERALEEPPAPPIRSSILIDIALIDAAVGAASAVDEVSDQLQRVRTADERARVLQALARLLFARSDFDAAGRAIHQSLAELESDPTTTDDLLTEVRADQLAIAELSPQLSTRVRPRVTELLADATPDSLAGRPELLSRLASWRLTSGAAHAQVGQIAQAALSADWDNNRFYGMATGRAAITMLAVDELGSASRPIERALQRAQQTGSLIGLGFAYHWLATLRYCEGNLPAAIEAAQACLDVCRTGWNVCQPYAGPILGHALIDQGDPDGAAAALRLAEDPAFGGGAENPLNLAAQGRLALSLGKHETAVEFFCAVGSLPQRADLEQPVPLAWRCGAAIAFARLGETDRAEELAAEEIERTRAVAARRGLGTALRVAGLVAGGERGVELLTDAVSVLERSPASLERARALVDLGAVLRAENEPLAAREPLRRGLELAERCAARPLAARAADQLRSAGGRRRRENIRNDELTSAERRIVRFAVQGASTPDIAQNLYLSPKTVEWHLGNIYRKLGVRSRSELADAVA